MDSVTHAPLAGRAGERLVLRQMITALADGHGNVCWVQGEQGIGKSALVNAELLRAAKLGCLTLRATPREMAADEPARERLLNLVYRTCAERPAALAFADMQRASKPDLLLWKLLADATHDIPLLLIGSARPAPRVGALAGLRELTEQRGGTVIELGPLDPASAEILADAIVGGKPGPRLRHALARAGGNPLYLTELATAFVAGGLVETRNGTAEIPSDTTGHRNDTLPLPASLAAVIEDRLREVPGDLLVALRVAAALGSEFGADEWAAATVRDAVDMAETVQAAVTEGLLSGTGDRLRFQHQVVCEVLAGQVPLGAWPTLRAGIARKLADGGCGVAAVEKQLRAASGAVEPWVLEWLAGQNEPSLDAAPMASAVLLERAVAAADGHPCREMLAVRLSQVLSWLGHAEQACTWSESIARQAGDPDTAVKMRLQAMEAASQAGRPELAAWALTGQPDDGRLPAAWRARLAAWSAVLQRAAGQPDAAALVGQAEALAGEADDPVTHAYARYARAICGRADMRVALLDDALAALPGPGRESERLRAIVLAGRIAAAADSGQPTGTDHPDGPLQADQPDPGAGELREGLRFASRIGGTRALPVLIASAGWNYRYGRWDRALECLAQAKQAADGTPGGAYPGEALPSRYAPGAQEGMAAVIALRRGDRAVADALLRGATDAAGACYPLDEALALRAEADSDMDSATALMARWLSAPHGLIPRDLRYLTYLALAAGDRDTARAATAASRAEAAADGGSARVIVARFCQALVSDDTARLLTIAGDCEGYGWVPLRASALEEAAVRLAAAGEVTRARSALTAAAQGYAGLGAAWDLQRADARLKVYGIRRGPNSLRRRPAAGWDALTPKERDVARLAAEGQSNNDIAARLFLSPRTVESHMSRVRAKLGVSSRVEIVRAAQNAAGASPGPPAQP
jgi:DNA-binding CsgD family transcriptional regulator